MNIEKAAEQSTEDILARYPELAARISSTPNAATVIRALMKIAFIEGSLCAYAAVDHEILQQPGAGL